jgi:ribosome biogenesis GTPase
VSALADEGLESLHPFLGPGQTVGLLGSSGVGKSTLINTLAGTQRQRVAPVRASDGRGRHTTTHRELIPLPSGALIIDTPGLRELQLWGDEEALASSFEEIEQLAGGCRFRDCSHEGEPGCAVRAAVERGELTAERLESYHRQRRELRHLELRNTHHQREQERRFDKHVQKSLRRHFRHKGRL